MVNKLTEIREWQKQKAEKIVETFTNLKDGAVNNIKDGYEALRGSGSVLEELRRAKEAAKQIPGDIGTGAANAAAKFLTLQPIQGTKDAVAGTVKTLKDVGKAIAVPFVSTAVAMTGNVLGAGKKVIAVPGKALGAIAKGPIKVFGVIKKGVTDFFESPPAQTSAPAVDMSAPATPPPLPDKPKADTSMPEDKPEPEEKPADKPEEGKQLAA